jgi:hypothetical protein
MAELTLESLAARVAALEAQLAKPAPAATDWRSVIRMFDDAPGFQDVIDEGVAFREAERAKARSEGEE